MSFRATCQECSKAYNVPHDRKEWRCKVCDVVLTIEDDEPEPESDSGRGESDMGERSCGGCGALNFGDGAFCEECGESLEGDSGEGAGLTRKEAAGDMRKSMKRIRRLKSWVGLNLVLSIIGTLALVAMLVNSDGLSMGEVAFVCAIQFFFLGLSYAAYRFIDRKPFPIVIGLAALQTLSVIWQYMDGSKWQPSLIWAALLWWLVVDAAHVTQLAKDHPDLYLSKRMRGEHITHKGKRGRGGSGVDRDSSSARTRAAGRGTAETNWFVLGGVLLAVLALGYAAVTATSKGGGSSGRSSSVAAAAAKVSPREATENFRSAWNAHDVDVLADMTKASLSEKMRVSLSKLGDRYEWGTQFPQLEAAVYTEPKSANVRVIFPSEAGEFPVRFIFEDGAWVVRTIKTSPLKAWRPQ